MASGQIDVPQPDGAPQSQPTTAGGSGRTTRRLRLPNNAASYTDDCGLDVAPKVPPGTVRLDSTT